MFPLKNIQHPTFQILQKIESATESLCQKQIKAFNNHLVVPRNEFGIIEFESKTFTDRFINSFQLNLFFISNNIYCNVSENNINHW